MSTETEPLFDVVIYKLSSHKVDAVIGKNLKAWTGKGSDRNTAELRQQTGLEKVNDKYSVRIVPAGLYEKGDKLEEFKS